MEAGKTPGPVRYRDVATQMSRPTFRNFYRRIIGDLHLHKDVADDPDKITDALLARYPTGVLRGFAALKNMGFTINLDDWTPFISISRDTPLVQARSGRVLRRVEKDIVTIRGRRSVNAVQAVVDVLTTPENWGPWRDGTCIEEHVAFVDHLLRQNQKLLNRLKDDPRTHAAASLANPLAESRPESIVRVRLHQAGLTEWRPQIKVRGRDGFYFVNLGDPLLRVGVEYQGAHHFDRNARAKDAQRANDLSWAGWTIMEATSVLMASEVEWRRFLGRLREELVAARQMRNSRIA